MTNFEKIILTAVGVLIVIVLAVGAVVFRQQKTITALAGSAAGTPNQAAVQSPAQKSGPPLAEVIKNFFGSVESISGNQLILDVKLPDFSKPKDPNKMKNANGPMNLTAADFETLEKKITVNTNGTTVFTNKKLADLKVGDTVSVNSDKSPY